MSFGAKYATFSSGIDRYTSVVDRFTPGMVRYGSRGDRVTPPEMELTNSCRSLLLSRLKAAEELNRQLSEDSDTINRLRSIHPPGEYNVDLAIEQVRAQLLDLIETDIKVIRQLLNVGEQLEEMKWQRNYGVGGGVGGGELSPSIDMSLADIESVDLDPYMDYLASNNKRLRDDVINGDDADDVFQNDETGRNGGSSIQSNELRLTLTRSGNGVKVNSSNENTNSLKLNSSNSKPVSKLTKVEFQVNGSQERENKPRPRVPARGHDLKAKENYETAKVALKLAGTKDVEPTTVASPSLQFRLVLQPNNDTSQSENNELSMTTQEPQQGQMGANEGSNTSQGHRSKMNLTSRTQSSHIRLGNQSQGHRQLQIEETETSTIVGTNSEKNKPTINIVTHL